VAKLDLNLMAVLEAVYDEGNTSRAAEALHLSQSAVSHALARLRTVYDDPLFTRQGHMMMPSPMTERVIGQVKSGLAELRRSVDEAHAFDPLQHQQVFNLSQRDALEMLLLGPLMAQLEQEAPLVKLHSTPSAPYTLVNQLEQGEVDACIELPQLVPEHIHQVRLFAAPLAVVGRQGHPFFERSDDEEFFLSFSQVLVTPLQGDMEWVDHALAKRHAERNVVLRCRSYSSALQVLLNSNHLSIMPKGYVEDRMSILPLTSAAVPFDVPNPELYLYWHQRTHADPAHHWFRMQLVKAFDGVNSVTLDKQALQLMAL